MQQKLFARLDSDGTGGVDAAELQEALDALSRTDGQGASASSATVDADDDGQLSGAEATSFKAQLEARFQQGGGGDGTGSPEGLGATTSPASGFEPQELSILARLATARYGAVEGSATGTSSNASSLSLAA
jgi:hypothetical protein